MPELVADCPRCGIKHITFDVFAENIVNVLYGWQNWYEAFSVCRHCKQGTIFVLRELSYEHHQYLHANGLLNMRGAINEFVGVDGYISAKDKASVQPPEHLPTNVEAAFKEGAKCAAIGCYNAAGTMFRLCIDLATRSMLPDGDADGLNPRTRRDLGLRLPWLFDSKILPEGLRELSSCIKDDGNDGAHSGNLSEDDVNDLLDFSFELLERIYTEPARLELAKARRNARRQQSK